MPSRLAKLVKMLILLPSKLVWGLFVRLQEQFLLLSVVELFQVGTRKVDLEHQEQISKHQLPDMFRCRVSVMSHAKTCASKGNFSQNVELTNARSAQLPLIDICDELTHEYQ